jgi:hypothetical protein
MPASMELSGLLSVIKGQQEALAQRAAKAALDAQSALKGATDAVALVEQETAKIQTFAAQLMGQMQGNGSPSEEPAQVVKVVPSGIAPGLAAITPGSAPR